MAETTRAMMGGMIKMFGLQGTGGFREGAAQPRTPDDPSDRKQGSEHGTGIDKAPGTGRGGFVGHGHRKVRESYAAFHGCTSYGCTSHGRNSQGTAP